ncbi:uncharacterized protein VTP21DRAFT_3695 [Calcarisporiella thermophila]|uniref:uncharacterized protein n=1 Tax=Calcarisporiella thermophila TaxID=911321 RepID=UPI003743B9CB
MLDVALASSLFDEQLQLRQEPVSAQDFSTLLEKLPPMDALPSTNADVIDAELLNQCAEILSNTAVPAFSPEFSMDDILNTDVLMEGFSSADELLNGLPELDLAMLTDDSASTADSESPVSFTAASPAGNWVATIDPTLIKCEELQDPQMEESPSQPLQQQAHPMKFVFYNPNSGSDDEHQERHTRARTTSPVPSSPDSTISSSCSSGSTRGLSEQPMPCPHPGCTKQFTRHNSLKAHIRLHASPRPYDCPMCRRSFSRKHDLHRHIRVHTGAKPYECPACHKGFARSDALRRHWRQEESCGKSPLVGDVKGRRRHSTVPT